MRQGEETGSLRQCQCLMGCKYASILELYKLYTLDVLLGWGGGCMEAESLIDSVLGYTFAF